MLKLLLLDQGISLECLEDLNLIVDTITTKIASHMETETCLKCNALVPMNMDTIKEIVQ